MGGMTDSSERKGDLLRKWRGEGIAYPEELEKEDKHWDHNVITPGTGFMMRLSRMLNYYIIERMSTNEKWKDLKVVFSDWSIPGEGEHKVLDYIRL
jgi:5'-3' exoribonuclease 2